MKKTIALLLATVTCLVAGNALAVGSNGLTAYGTYWDGENPGYGLGLKYSKSLLDIVSVDGRGTYIMFDDVADTTMVPLEVAFNLGFPGPISPYAGVGVGYYFIDNPLFDDATGYFGQIGLEFTIVKVGVMAELRYMDLEGEYFDDLALNVGILLKF
jgi:hypothetical protein